MHIRELLHKTTAFTLAEMMVILTVMSVVMAATMPIITAPDSAVLNGEASGDNLWAYGNASRTLSTPNFIAVGITPTVNYAGIDVASLYVNNRSDDKNSSQILFTVSPDSRTVYNAGRLFMGGSVDNAYNIALGTRALANVGNNDIKNVAIGSLAMYSNSSNPSRKQSVALGSKTLYMTDTNNSVAIGKNALSATSNSTAEETVGIGYFAGTMNSGTMKRSVHVGYMAGYTTDANHSETDNINIGYQAGALTKGDRVINIGTLAGFNSNNLYNNNQADSSSNYVNIGYNAGAMPYGITYNTTWQNSYSNAHVAIGNHALYAPFAGVTSTIAIGSYAGYNIRGDSKESIFIGSHAGAELQQGNPQDRIVALGAYANYKNAGTAVAVGYGAGMYTGSSTYAGLGRSAKPNNDKMLNEVAIGYMAGTIKNYTGGSYGNIFIGNRSGTNLNSSTIKPLVNSICLGHDSCPEGTSAVYSLFIGSYAGAAPTTSATNKLASFSIITTEWMKPTSGNVNTGIVNSLFKSVVHYNDSKADKWGQMILAPAPKNYTSSRITLEATTVKAPSSQPLIYSDIKMKKNIKPLKYSLKELKGINVYEYNYLDEGNTRRIGVMAQDLLKVMPEAVNKSDKEHYTINPDWVFYSMINAVKELDKTVQSYKATVLAYAKEYQTLSAKLKSLEDEQKQIEKERKSLEKQINKAYRKAEKMEKSA